MSGPKCRESGGSGRGVTEFIRIQRVRGGGRSDMSRAGWQAGKVIWALLRWNSGSWSEEALEFSAPR